MKKFFALVVALALAFSLVACSVSIGSKNANSGGSGSAAASANTSSAGGNHNSNNASSAGSNPPAAAGSSQTSAPSSGIPGGVNLNHYWPADKVPDLPEYTYGKITGFTGPDADGVVIIKAGETSKADLDKYLQSLQTAGWTVNITDNGYDTDYAVADKGAYSVNFQIQADTFVQFDVTIAKTGGWPSPDEYPITLVQPQGFEVIGADISTEDLDGVEYYIFSFACVGMDETAANAYVADKAQLGYDWKGEHWNCKLDEEYPYSKGDKMMFEFTIYPDSIS